MSEFKLQDVNLVLIDHRSQVRTGLRMALNEAGIHNNNIIDGPDVSTVLDCMQNAVLPDVLICDAEPRGGDVLKMIHSIRHNELGQNPFLAIIAISWDPTQSLVDKVSNSGADFLLAAPFSPQQIFDRIKSLVHNRTPFIVTSDYVGPDRRYKDRAQSTIPLIDVPNSLRQKVFGEFNAKEFRNQVLASVGDINTQKMERHAVRLAGHADLLVTQYDINPETMDSSHVDQLQVCATDLKWRAHDAGLNPVTELCEALQNVVRRINRAPAQAPAKEIELMKQLSMAIRRAFEVEDREAMLVSDVASAVSARD